MTFNIDSNFVLLLMASVLVFREYQHSKQINSLLDRLMSSSFHELKKEGRLDQKILIRPKVLPPLSDKDAYIKETSPIGQTTELNAELEERLSAVKEHATAGVR